MHALILDICLIYKQLQTMCMKKCMGNPELKICWNVPVSELGDSTPIYCITQVHCELHSAPIQLQTQGVRWLLWSGGHQQPKGPLGHEAERHILGLCVHRPWQQHLQIHAAVIAHWGGLCGYQEEWELADTEPQRDSQQIRNTNRHLQNGTWILFLSLYNSATQPISF